MVRKNCFIEGGRFRGPGAAGATIEAGDSRSKCAMPARGSRLRRSVLRCNPIIDDPSPKPYMAVRVRGRSPRVEAPETAMLVTLMKAKLHRATVTQADLEYEGSIAIDGDLLDASGILPHEQVDVLNITNGARFTTYAIEAPRGSRVIGVNGAAARLVQKNDKVIIVTYGQLPQEEARQWSPTVVLLDDRNEIKRAA
jgi:aspartate 1-decarboxylase